MKYFIRFNQFGIDIPDQFKTKDEILNVYIAQMGGPQYALDYFLKHLHLYRDNIKDAEIIQEENDGSIVSLQETPN